MSSLFFIASKFRSTPNIVNRGSMLIRGLANNRGLKINICRTNVVTRNLKDYSVRHFGISSLKNSSTKAKVDSNNILSSSFNDVGKYTDIYVHDLVWNKMESWPEKTAMVCSATGRSYTYSQMRKLAGKLATSMRKSNLRPGDTIAAILPNVPEYALVILAASEAGLRITLINPAYTSDEIRKQLKNSNASAIFTVPSKHSVVAASIVGNSEVRLPIIVIEDGNGEAPDGTIKFRDLVKDDVEEFRNTGEKPEIDTEDTFLLPYSSGTSGLPKGVELSHRNLVANIMQLRSKGVSIAEETTATHQEILPLVLPIYHIYGLVVCLGLYLCIGGKLVCVPQFSPENLFKVLEENRSTLFYLAPPLIQLLANDERLKNHHLETIRTIVSGAAPIGEEVLTKFISRVSSELKVVQGYGMTECAPVISMGSNGPSVSTGNVVPKTQIRIVGYETENEGKNLGFNEVGEIFVRGPQVMKGYYRNPEATASCMEGEWFKTGDLGCYDESGLLYIRGRLKELIKVQGYQVAPAEIEDLIQGHEKVADAAVIGMTDERYGEVPKAFVVPKNGAKIDPNELKEWIAERVAKYKRLGHVEFIEKIPKSAAGKILRKELHKL